MSNFFVELACHLPELNRLDQHFQDNEPQQHRYFFGKFPERWDMNMGLLGEKQVCYLFAMQPPIFAFLCGHYHYWSTSKLGQEVKRLFKAFCRSS